MGADTQEKKREERRAWLLSLSFFPYTHMRHRWGSCYEGMAVRLLVAPSADTSLLSFLGASMFFKYVTPAFGAPHLLSCARQE